MDSDHRHELKENDLAEFMRNFGQFWTRWGNSLLLVVLVVLIAVVSVQMITAHRFRRHEQNWSSLEFETSPAALASVAETVSHPPIRALAHLRAGDALLRGEAVDAVSSPDDASASGPAAAQRRLRQAAEHYEAVRQMADADALFKLNALLGLAAVAESQRQWDLAQQLYEQAVAESREQQQPALAEQAAQRLAMLDRLREPMTLAPAAPETPAAPDADAPLQEAAPADTADAAPPAAAPADTDQP